MAVLRDMSGVIEIPGPWQHRHVAANGARFHVAEAVPSPAGASEAPLVLLLHGFPEFWWAWRAQLPRLAEAGYRAVAMDLRGYGASDKTPRGYDPVTLARDVVGVVKALGERQATLVGHSWGGYVGWAAAALHPRQVRALCATSAPHPLAMLAGLRSRHQRQVLSHVLAMQVPMLPERRLSRPESGFLERHLSEWSSPGSAFPDARTVSTYQAAMSLWPAPHCALEYHRWLLRSRLRFDGRSFNEVMEEAIRQPVLRIDGTAGAVAPDGADGASRRWVAGPYTAVHLPEAGHFPHEESPESFTAVLLDWLRGLPG